MKYRHSLVSSHTLIGRDYVSPASLMHFRHSLIDDRTEAASTCLCLDIHMSNWRLLVAGVFVNSAIENNPLERINALERQSLNIGSGKYWYIIYRPLRGSEEVFLLAVDALSPFGTLLASLGILVGGVKPSSL
jgi:hypothetical protein